MRQAAQAAFAAGGDKSILERCVERLEDPKKLTNYRQAAAGLAKFIGRQRPVTFPTTSLPWTSGSLTAMVRPDFILDIAGLRRVVLIYWKDDALTQHKINPVLQILRETHGHIAEPMVIEARTGKSFTITRPVRGLSSLLASEAVAFVTLWDSDLEAA